MQKEIAMKFYNILILFVCVKLCENAKILVLLPLQSKSHFVMFERYVKGLVNTGHEVDVVSHFPQEKPIPGYTDYSLKGTLPEFVNSVSLKDVRARSNLDFILNECGIDVCENFFNTDIAKMLRDGNRRYDLIVTEIFTNDCLLGYAYIFKVPVIALTTSVNLPWSSDMFGLPDNPSYIPTYFTPSSNRMDFFERMTNTFTLLYMKYIYKKVSYTSATTLARQFFGDDLPEIEDLANNISLLLLNNHFSLNGARPLVPNVIEVGGLHIGDVKPLPKHLEEIMNTNLNGVIYFSTGSMIMTETFDLDKLQAIIDAFAEMPYKILWKANVTNLPIKDIPDNIHFETWFPQLDVLCHPNVKLFISHAGLMGTQEATYCGVPIIAIPIWGDQEHNIHTIEYKERGLRLAYDDITKSRMLRLLLKVLNPKYAQNAQMGSKLFKDRILKPLDEAIYWTEYVLRHGGAPQLRTEGSRLPFYQYYLIDLALGIVAFLAVVFYALQRALCKKKFTRRRHYKVKRN